MGQTLTLFFVWIGDYFFIKAGNELVGRGISQC